MKLGLRIFLCYLTAFLFCFYWPFDWVRDTLKSHYYKSAEDPLVDQANILAAMVGQSMEQQRFSAEELAAVFARVYGRNFIAQVYDLTKTSVDMRVYITDAKGKILFDSKGWARPGTDYSKWRDVHRTLDGRYGARSTQMLPPLEKTSILYVAAPIIVADKMVGVLSVGKPTTNITSFMDRARPRFYRVSIMALGATAIISFLLSLWMTHPIKGLTRYAAAIGKGKRASLPRLDSTETGELGRAFEQMRQALEGKRYVEQYVQAFTHEIKSPLSAIRGAAELLDEDMDAERRLRFHKNIRSESRRIQRIVERMLELASLENKSILGKREMVELRPLVKTVLESKEPMIDKKGLRVKEDVENIQVPGDPFLLFQAIANLVQNAIDFSKKGGNIAIESRVEAGEVLLNIMDDGVTIPDYAMEENKIFDKFFSLGRPDNEPKSTGLGLNLVREAAKLHGGGIHLVNQPEGGVIAVLRLPAC